MIVIVRPLSECHYCGVRKRAPCTGLVEDGGKRCSYRAKFEIVGGDPNLTTVCAGHAMEYIVDHADPFGDVNVKVVK